MEQRVTLNSMKAKYEQIRTRNNPSSDGQQRTFRPRDPQEVDLTRINFGEEVRVRFVNDGDTSNYFFWRAYCFHELFFKGVKGDDSKSNVFTFVQIPAYNMIVSKITGQLTQGSDAELNVPAASKYTNWEDPIQVYTSQNNLYSQTDRTIKNIYGNDVSLYSCLKRKVQYLVNGYIISAPESLKIYEEARPLKHLRLAESLLKKIENLIYDEEASQMGDEPTNDTEGVDFNFRKSQNGQYANYDDSGFARKHTSLPESALLDLQQYGYDHICDRIPKTPTVEDREVIKEMLEAFLGGKPYDPAWDKLGYVKYTRLSRVQNEEPDWNSPSSTYVGEEADLAQHNAVLEANNIAAETIASITGVQNINQMVNDEIPTTFAKPAEPTPVQQQVSQVSGISQSPEDVLSFLKSQQQ